MNHWFRLPNDWAHPILPPHQFGNWSFRWTIHGHSEGLTLLDVKWKGIKVIHKASLPVIRVKYKGFGGSINAGCGPYNDQIGGVKTKEFTGIDSDVVGRIWDDNELLEIAVFDQIGGYQLYQSWLIWNHARLEGVVGSRGWSCYEEAGNNWDHRHHTYWRVDFDVESIPNELSTFRTPITGPATFQKQTIEGQQSRQRAERLFGARVTSTISDKHVIAYINGNGLADDPGGHLPWFSFSQNDIFWRRYHAREDNGWAERAITDLGFANPPENIDREDIVLWFVAHMGHDYDPHWDPLNPEDLVEMAGLDWHFRYLTMEPSW